MTFIRFSSLLLSILIISASTNSLIIVPVNADISFESKLLQTISAFKWEKSNVELVLGSKVFVDGDYSDVVFDNFENKKVLEVKSRGTFSAPIKICSYNINDIEIRLKFLLEEKPQYSEVEISLLSVNGSIYGLRVRSDGSAATYAGDEIKCDYRTLEDIDLSKYNDFRILRDKNIFTVYINGVEFSNDFIEDAAEHLVLSIRFLNNTSMEDAVRISWIRFDGEEYEDFSSSEKKNVSLKAFISNGRNVDDEATSMLLWFAGDSLLDAKVISEDELEDFYHYFLYLACKSDNAWSYTDMINGELQEGLSTSPTCTVGSWSLTVA